MKIYTWMEKSNTQEGIMKHEPIDKTLICTCGFQARTEGSLIIHCANKNDELVIRISK